ncbi:MAG: hypothetical protein JXQ73_07585 [Phycisphaerae bacterium]|nr:hypothetical protein [Phycisphaerae bacterium]
MKEEDGYVLRLGEEALTRFGVLTIGGDIGESSPSHDWGNGAASEARNRIHDHYGDVYIDRPRQQAFGIDSIGVERTSGGYRLTDQAGMPREIKIVLEDGSSRVVNLQTGDTIVRVGND